MTARGPSPAGAGGADGPSSPVRSGAGGAYGPSAPVRSGAGGAYGPSAPVRSGAGGAYGPSAPVRSGAGGAYGASGPGASDAAGRLATMIERAGSVVALTGAGISVPSGIPDFRSPQTGLWTKVDPMEVAHIDVFQRDPERFWSFYGRRFDALDDKQPNRAHGVLAALECAGLLDAVITQNIDRLHERAGSREVIEVHGSIANSSCLLCGSRFPLAEVRRRQAGASDGVPPCDCGSPLKPDVVLFGELLPAAAIARAERLAAGADLLLCIGSSLEVYPVAGLPELTLAAGGKLAIITQGPTQFDRLAAVRMEGDVVEDLEALRLALGLEAG